MERHTEHSRHRLPDESGHSPRASVEHQERAQELHCRYDAGLDEGSWQDLEGFARSAVLEREEVEPEVWDHFLELAGDATQASNWIPQGFVEGRYRLRRHLGSGGFGQVWEAEDTRIQRNVAIKFIPGEATAEAAYQAQGGEPLRNICTIYDLVRLGSHTALIMQLLSGGTLAERLEGGPLSPDRAVAITCRLADGLAFMHDRDVLHLDIKPANVLFAGVNARQDDPAVVGPPGLWEMLDNSSRINPANVLFSGEEGQDYPFLCDFGVAASQGLHGRRGTPSYMAPEALRGEELTPAADVWSLGVVLYEMLTGILPFGQEWTSNAPRPADPHEIESGIPRLSKLCLRMLEVDRMSRPTMDEVRGRLQRIPPKAEVDRKEKAASRDRKQRRAHLMRKHGLSLLSGNGPSEDKEKGARWLKDAAEAGDWVACRHLGIRLLDGDGFSQDQEEGAKWLRKSLENFDDESLRIFGVRLIDGNGLPQDRFEGERMLRLAALGDDLEAMRQLGRRLLDGDGLPQNQEEGEKWLRRAVEGDDLEAMRELGRRLLSGSEGLRKDRGEALRILHLAAVREDAAALELLREDRNRRMAVRAVLAIAFTVLAARGLGWI